MLPLQLARDCICLGFSKSMQMNKVSENMSGVPVEVCSGVGNPTFGNRSVYLT